MTSGTARFRSAQRLADAATAHHQSGALEDAERSYQAALAIDPALPGALHGLGLLALGRGLSAQAVALIGKASALRPHQALYTLNLGHALRAQGHVEEARAALTVACLQDPGDPRAHAALAQVLEQLGRIADSTLSARTALGLATDPVHASGMQALLGRAALDAAEWTGAVAALAAAVIEDGTDAHSWQGLAVAHAALGDDVAAERCFRTVVALRPDDPAPLANLGAWLFERNRMDEAFALLHHARSFGAPTAETDSNLGLVMLALGHLEDAERTLARARQIAPGLTGIAVNHGTALLELGRLDEAERCFAAVEQTASGGLDADRARFNRASLLLGTGRFQEGWPLFEARAAVLGRRRSSLPAWDGTRLEPGAALLVEAEQGLGDVIQFLRYVPLTMSLARVVLVLPLPLVRLARQSLPHDCTVIAIDEPTPACTVRADLLSLPLLLSLDRPFWPGAYLRAAPVPSAGTIGLCWSGSPTYRFDRRRSLALHQFAPLATTGRRFTALQPSGVEQPAPRGMELDRPILQDMADTASLIEALELVITVDTAVAHLAGALGRPVWLLNRFGGDWRWWSGNLDQKNRSLWYPGLRVFSQPEPRSPQDAWDSVIDHVATALRDHTGQRSVSPLEEPGPATTSRSPGVRH